MPDPAQNQIDTFDPVICSLVRIDSPSDFLAEHFKIAAGDVLRVLKWVELEDRRLNPAPVIYNHRAPWGIQLSDQTKWTSVSRPEIVCIVGEFDDAQLRAAANRLTLEGKICLGVPLSGDLSLAADLHRHKINLCDRVVFVRSSDLVAIPLAQELFSYANRSGKPVSFADRPSP